MLLPTNNNYRSWLFSPGHDQAALQSCLDCRPAMLVVDLEEFTPAEQKIAACELFQRMVPACAEVGVQCAIRLDQLDQGGEQQLALIAAARPQAVLLPQIEQPEQLRQLRRLMDHHGLSDTPMIPTIESQAGLSRLEALLTAAPMISAALLGTGDLSRDLGLQHEPQRMQLLQPLRTDFADLCRRHGVEAIDGPWPERSDSPDYRQDCDFSRSAGFRSRCALTAGQVLNWQANNPNNRAGDEI